MKTFQSRRLCVATLLSCSLLVGCGEKTPEKAASSAKQSGTPEMSESGGHGHGAGPHDGTLADWGGGKYHVEFTVDHDKKEATVYILGSDEKTPEPIAADKLLLTINEPKLQTDLLPDPLDGESSGNCSRFVGTHDGLGTVMEYEGIISAEVDGTPYAGNFKEEAHGSGGSGGQAHSHGDDDALVWEGGPKEHAGLTIKLGHHGGHLHAGEEVEPAVSITRNGEAVSDARVFNALFSADGKELAKEVATVFEPTTKDEPAHYAQGALAIPSGLSKAIIRFRIVPAGADAVEFDLPVIVE
jgi:hypothetical protein